MKTLLILSNAISPDSPLSHALLDSFDAVILSTNPLVQNQAFLNRFNVVVKSDTLRNTPASMVANLIAKIRRKECP